MNPFEQFLIDTLTLRGKALKGGFTVWKMRLNTPTPTHVNDWPKAITECLRQRYGSGTGKASDR